MKKNEKVIIDTNIWVYYLNEDSKFHKISKDIIKNYIDYNVKIHITSQIFRELLVVLTGEKYLEKPLSLEIAIEKVTEIENSVSMLFESEKSNNRLKKLILDNQIKGIKIHDANIMAVALENSIDTICTNNPKDFTVSGTVKIVNLAK